MSASTRNLRKICAAVVLLLVLVLTCCDGCRSRSKKPALLRILTSGPRVSATYQHGNLTCIKCGPGHYVASHCLKSYTQSECRPCGPGTYSSRYSRARRCIHCAECYNAHSEILARCTPTSNTQCICEAGYGAISSDDTGHSKDCIVCAHLGKMSVMDRTKGERICVSRCPDSQFYEEEAGECRQCTDCEAAGSATSQPCSPASDAVCQQPPSPTSTTVPQEEEKTDGLSGGAISGIVIAVLLAVGAVVVGLVYWRQRNNDNLQHRTVLNPGEEKQLQDQKQKMMPKNGTDDVRY